jgi:hypothetical protein
MRHRSIWPGLLAAIGTIACSTATTETVKPPVTVTLRVGDGAAIQGTPWTVTFDSVITDSRCPLGVMCIQAGEALLALELTSALDDAPPPDPGVAPHFSLGLAPKTVSGFRFSVEEVEPIRRQHDTIDPRSYKIKLHIEAVSPP